ncbi:MAG: metal ABC transporter substrate-binding protein [Gemmatimonadota bacterium]
MYSSILMLLGILTLGPPLAEAERHPSGTASAEDPLRIVTTTTDLADIAGIVGGERVDARSLALGEQDPHFVEPRPSLILELRRADLYAQVGLELEVGWAPLLLDQSRNPQIQPGARGHLDLSTFVEVLDVPTTRVTRAQGDVHPFGNPHYWLSPANGRRIAEAFAQRLSDLDPTGSEVYAANLERFLAEIDSLEAEWEPLVAPFRGQPVVAYHASWKYFVEFLGLEILDYVEPLPGIPPSPRHLADLVDRMNRAEVQIIVAEPFYDTRVPSTVANRTGARLLVLPSSVGAVPGVTGYLQLLDHNVRSIVGALRD